MYKKILYLFCFIGLVGPLISCDKEDLFPLDSKIIWVNSFLGECPSPSLVSRCLNISEAQEFDDAIWDIKVRQIKGFDYKEGFIYQLRVQETLPSKNNFKQFTEKNYRLLKVLSKEFDWTIEFGGMYRLEYLDGYSNKGKFIIGKRFIFGNRTLDGTYKCNRISYKAKGMTKDKMSFSISAISDEDCDPVQDDITHFEELLKEKFLQVERYEFANVEFNLMDRAGKTLIILQSTHYNPKPGI